MRSYFTVAAYNWLNSWRVTIHTHTPIVCFARERERKSVTRFLWWYLFDATLLKNISLSLSVRCGSIWQFVVVYIYLFVFLCACVRFGFFFFFLLLTFHHICILDVNEAWKRTRSAWISREIECMRGEKKSTTGGNV